MRLESEDKGCRITVSVEYLDRYSMFLIFRQFCQCDCVFDPFTCHILVRMLSFLVTLKNLDCTGDSYQNVCTNNRPQYTKQIGAPWQGREKDFSGGGGRIFLLFFFSLSFAKNCCNGLYRFLNTNTSAECPAKDESRDAVVPCIPSPTYPFGKSLVCPR